MSKPYQDPETLHHLYWEERLNTKEIADKFDVAPRTIRYHMDKNGIERTAMGPKITPPGMFVSPQGYEVFEPDDGGGRLRHHRLLAVAEFGFAAVAGNDVHHKNGMSWDNRPSNIRVLSHKEHAAIHAEESRMWEYRKNV